MEENPDPIRLAEFYVAAQRWAEVIDALRNADPDDVRTWALRSQALSNLGQPEKAADHARRGLALDPNNTSLLAFLAFAQSSLRKFEEAESSVRKGLEIDPENVQLLSTYVIVLLRWRRWESAERVMRKVRAIAPEETQQLWTMFLLNAPGSSEATKAAMHLLAEQPDDATSHFLIGLAQLRAARVGLGIRHLRQAVALQPANPVFAAAAREKARWYVRPVHATSGWLHPVLAGTCGVIALLLWFQDQSFVRAWIPVTAWLIFNTYKWIAHLASEWLMMRSLKQARKIRYSEVE